MLRMKSMKSEKRTCSGFADAFYGSATVGERGQIVIPADARQEIGFTPGDKVLIFKHPLHQGLMLLKIESLREFMDDFAAGLAQIEESKEDNKE